MGKEEIKGFLFDLDGVIIDSESLYTRFWEETEGEFPTGIPDFAHHIKGTTVESIMQYFPEQLRGEILQRIYRFDANLTYPLFDGAVSLLTKLKARGIKTAIVTSSNREKMEQFHKVLPQMRPLFDVIVGGESVSHGKPDPEGYLLAARNLSLAPEQCIVVEDSVQGMRAGRAAGCQVWGVCTTVATNIVSELADRVFPDISAINEYMK